jgi:hypothetical protein
VAQESITKRAVFNLRFDASLASISL